MKNILFSVLFLMLYPSVYAQTDTLKSPSTEEIEEVILKSTRTSRTIANTPTRIETIALEEIDEKSNMRPSNVAMILHESTGIAVQQTSATSGNSSIRIQGLDGRYTQLLKDGFPSFGNFANGLSILEIPPLDLNQVEIIKGPSSTLYGAGAIAGVINFISREPKERQNLDIITNYANTGLLNLGVFTSRKYGKFGYTFTGLFNSQKEFDVDHDDFSELPRSREFTLNPKIFLYLSENSEIILGNAFTTGNRTGGDMQAITGNTDGFHQYFEKNSSIRNTTTLEFEHRFKEDSKINLRTALNIFDRSIQIPDYTFQGTSRNFYSDFSWNRGFTNQNLVLGANYINDHFKDRTAQVVADLTFRTETSGAYVQHTWDISENFKIENGLRADFVNYGNVLFVKKESFLLPKTSLLYRFNTKWSTRIGGGFGYKTPTSFTEQTDTFHFQNLKALQNISSEKSTGATADVNFKTKIGENLDFSINQMFFYTQLKNSLVLDADHAGNPFLTNTGEDVFSKGFETNIKLIYKDFIKFFGGYTYTDTKADYLPDTQKIPLVPANRINLALVAEKEGKFKTGFEAYFTDQQYLYDRSLTQPYWELGFMAEKYFGKFSVFINFENFTDTRQSRYKPVVSGSHAEPVFDEIWTHTEGRTFNGGIKYKF
ncbi:TonB-dependent receptor plug domain-containing protein [Chryseobacterium sp.]|uniref:TonB-dependent receptor plug domain-containing protein n=1 Tax=Chryseobacterium sp. TaxID=1871047 RepID=UPI0011C959BE|nr:TonB-dependent receptor plug domain-containing protein [Chryseobacterium sp.]TXF75035.1 TonB-dependent receptor [Chryseobacterium sp.]